MIKVIIVEDEEFICNGMILTTPWENFQCQVVGKAANGLEGMNLIKKIKPDIVITDVRMPKMDGINMIENLKNVVDTQYIIISGYDDFKYAQQAIKLGVKDYLLKPIDDEEFYRTLENLSEYIKGRRREKEAKKHICPKANSKSQFCNGNSFDEAYDGRVKYVSEAIDYIKNNYFQNINIKDLAENLYISESYLSRLFKEHTGYTLVEYITNYRMNKATELLKDHTIKIYEVAELVGYNDARYFSVLFKKHMGVSPMEFKYNFV
ncbi:MAG: response regulator [Clostridiales bacterium]|nr:response regulator [Clostridiales bacterium]